MAQVSLSKTTVLVFIVAILSAAAATVSAQGDSEMAPSPAPSIVSGSPFALPVSGAILCSSLLLSLLALLKH
uniref:Uncharacterized protein n=1 Tax=Nelumbo nucifera TaxID=4432 RepID=A0A822YBY4_NELNU|nr:TPA_asm: hypothetical protein HUJ06_031280 [Nelumbo nucifera]